MIAALEPAMGDPVVSLLVDLPAAPPAEAQEPEGTGGVVLRTSELEEALNGARILADLQPVTIDCGLALRRIIRALQPLVEDVAAERRKMIDRYAERTEDGRIVERADGTPIDPARIREYRLEAEAFQRRRHRVHVTPVKLSALVSEKDRRDTEKPAKIHAGALAMLGVLLDEDVA